MLGDLDLFWMGKELFFFFLNHLCHEYEKGRKEEEKPKLKKKMEWRQRGPAIRRRVVADWKGMSVVHVAEWLGVWWNLICCLLGAAPSVLWMWMEEGGGGGCGRGGDACAGKLNSAPPSAVSILLCSLVCPVALHSVTLMSCQSIGKAPGAFSLWFWLWFNSGTFKLHFQTICLAFPHLCTRSYFYLISSIILVNISLPKRFHPRQDRPNAMVSN